MDHQNLEYWQKSQTFNHWHARWHLTLANFNFQIHYRPGKQSGKPDALSRRADHLDIPPSPQIMLSPDLFVKVALDSEAALQKEIEKNLDSDTSIAEILYFLENDNTTAPPSIKKGFKDYDMEAGLLFYWGRIFVPDNDDIKRKLIQLFHDSPAAGHPGQQRTLELVSRRYYWPGIRSTVYKFVDTCEACQRSR